MDIDWGDAITGISVVAVSAIAGWLLNLRPRKRAEGREAEERKRADRAEAELRENRRRGEGPLFVPSEEQFNTLYVPIGTVRDSRLYRKTGEPDVLWARRDQVDDGASEVVLVVENRGQKPRMLSAKLEGAPIAFEESPEGIGDGKKRQWFRYPFQSSMRGVVQILEISFETGSGVKDVHRYRTQHGFRKLARIDPE